MEPSNWPAERQEKWKRGGRILRTVVLSASIILVIDAVWSYARGEPDHYSNEKSRSLTLSLGLMLSALQDYFKPPRSYVLTAGSGVMIALAVWLTLAGR